MSSQIYSRYVPPKKRNGKALSHESPGSFPSEVAGPAPFPTKHDASSTYARYVPSKNKRRKVEEPLERKRPYTAKSSLATAQDALSTHSVAEDESQPKTRAVGEADDPKHKRLMEKREKSLKKAAKLARKEAKKSAAKAGDNQTRAEAPRNEAEELHDLVPLPQPEPVPEPPPQSTTASLPSWLANPVRVSPTSSAPFSKVGIEPEAEKVLHAKGFKAAFAVQAAVLPMLLSGPSQSAGDVLVSAATGSGKTLAYVLPMIEDISRNVVTRLRGLVVMPTRELVIQAKEVCEMCVTAASGRKRVKVGTAVGNETLKAEQASLMEQTLQYDPAGYKDQLRRLNAKWESSDVESDLEDDFLCDDEELSALPDHVIIPTPKVDIIICTPGRLVEHLKSTPGFSLEYLKWLVIDEADKLLEQSFQQWLETVMAHLKPINPSFRGNNRVQKVVLSATMTRDIGQLNALKLFRPTLVVMEGSHGLEDHPNEQATLALPELIVESAVKAEDESLKPLYLLELLRRESMIGSTIVRDPLSSGAPFPKSDDESSAISETLGSISEVAQQSTPTDGTRGVLIFTKSNENAARLGRLLALLEASLANTIGTLTSTISTSSRRKIIQSFNAGKISILVASDLVSRGLDLPNLAHVINYDMPTSVTNYVHRIGRTARAGRKGWAWTIFTPVEGRWFWNEIARSQDIARQAGTKISRVNVDAESFGNELRKRYEAALDGLGREAKSSRMRTSDQNQHVG